MLEGMNAVEWGAFADGGQDTVIPVLLADLAAGTKAANALRKLTNLLVHQGGVMPVAAPAIPFVAELVLARCEPFAALVLLAGDLACAGSHARLTELPSDMALPPDAETALRGLLPTAVAALDDASHAVRGAAAVLLACGEGERDALVAAAEQEKKAEVLATLLPALALICKRLSATGAEGDARTPNDAALTLMRAAYKAAPAKLGAALALAQLEPTVANAKALVAVAKAAKARIPGVVWGEGELQAPALKTAVMILAPAGELEAVLALDVPGKLHLVLAAVLGYDKWSGPPKHLLASDLTSAQVRALLPLAEGVQAEDAAARKQLMATPSGVYAEFGLFALDRLLATSPPGPRDRLGPDGEPLWRTAWRATQAEAAELAWRAALNEFDPAARLAVALDFQDLRVGHYPPKLEVTWGDADRLMIGRHRVIVAALAGVPATLIEPHIGKSQLAGAQRALVHAWVLALAAEGKPVPANADALIAQALDSLSIDPVPPRDLLTPLSLERRDQLAGAADLSILVTDKVARVSREVFLREGWVYLEHVPALRARRKTTGSRRLVWPAFWDRLLEKRQHLVLRRSLTPWLHARSRAGPSRPGPTASSAPSSTRSSRRWSPSGSRASRSGPDAWAPRSSPARTRAAGASGRLCWRASAEACSRQT